MTNYEQLDSQVSNVLATKGRTPLSELFKEVVEHWWHSMVKSTLERNPHLDPNFLPSTLKVVWVIMMVMALAGMFSAFFALLFYPQETFALVFGVSLFLFAALGPANWGIAMVQRIRLENNLSDPLRVMTRLVKLHPYGVEAQILKVYEQVGDDRCLPLDQACALISLERHLSSRIRKLQKDMNPLKARIATLDSKCQRLKALGQPLAVAPHFIVVSKSRGLTSPKGINFIAGGSATGTQGTNDSDPGGVASGRVSPIIL